MPCTSQWTNWQPRDVRSCWSCHGTNPVLGARTEGLPSNLYYAPLRICSQGAFSHSAGTALIITVIIQVTTLKTTHLRNHAQSIQNSKIQTSDACHGSQGPKFCPL